MENYLSFFCQPAVVPSPRAMSSHDQSPRPDTWNLFGTMGNVFGHPRAAIDSSQTPYQGILHLWNQSATRRIPVQRNAGRPVVKREEQFRGTIPLPSFARRPCKSQTFILINSPSTFSCWKMSFKTQVSSCSGFPSEAMTSIREVEMVESVDDVKSSHSIQGCTHFPNFEMLDARIASALNKIIENSNFKKKISLEEQKAQKEDRFFRGRQIAYMVYDYFRVIGTHETVLDYADLFSTTLRNDEDPT